MKTLKKLAAVTKGVAVLVAVFAFGNWFFDYGTMEPIGEIVGAIAIPIAMLYAVAVGVLLVAGRHVTLVVHRRVFRVTRCRGEVTNGRCQTKGLALVVAAVSLSWWWWRFEPETISGIVGLIVIAGLMLLAFFYGFGLVVDDDIHDPPPP